MIRYINIFYTTQQSFFLSPLHITDCSLLDLRFDTMLRINGITFIL